MFKNLHLPAAVDTTGSNSTSAKLIFSSLIQKKENLCKAEYNRSTTVNPSNHRAFGRDISNYQNLNILKHNTTFSQQPRSNQNTSYHHLNKTIIEGNKESREKQCGVELVPSEVENKLKEYEKAMEKMSREDILEVDIKAYDNPSECVEYIQPIYKYLHEIEDNLQGKNEYLGKIQTDINEKMRAILIDWLVEVHSKFRLLPETLFLTCNIIDRYLDKEPVKRDRLQLVGVTAMLLASKYEEIYSPQVKDFVYITDKAYTCKDILDMEHKILQVLEFNLTVVSPLCFLTRYTKLSGVDQMCWNLSRYLLELPLIHYKMLKYSPAHLATAALFLAIKILKYDFKWTKELQKHFKHSQTSITPCAKDLYILLLNSGKTSLKAVYKKYSSPKYFEVAKIRVEDTK